MADEAPQIAAAEVEEVLEMAEHHGERAPTEEGQAPTEEGQAPTQEGEAPTQEGEAPTQEGEAPTHEGEAPSEEGRTSTQEEYVDEETEEETEPMEITPEMHEENLVVMREVLGDFIDWAAEGKMPEKREEKTEFVMREKVDSTVDLLEPEAVEEEEVKEDEFVSPEESLEGKEEEEEEQESASIQEAWKKRQQQLEEFDAVHDEAQRLRIMNMLLQSRVLRAMQRRPKKRGVTGSTASTGSAASTGGVGREGPMTPGDLAAIAESLEKELLEAGEVRKQLEVEMHRGVVEDDLRKRLATARLQVAETAAQLDHLQEKLMTRMRASPARRQDAERMLKRVWPQLLRLRRERLLHSRAKQELESAKQQVTELESFGPNRTVTAYEELLADGVKLAEHAQERSEQLVALRNVAEQNVQQAAHFREEIQGMRLSNIDARRLEVRASAFLKKAREEVLKTKRHRDTLYKENNKLKRDMELLANPELLRDHEEVLRRLRTAQAELEKLRMMYVNQERHIATARRLLEHRESLLREGVDDTQRHSYLVWRMDAKCGPSHLTVNDDDS